jgi:hypothetical protein
MLSLLPPPVVPLSQDTNANPNASTNARIVKTKLNLFIKSSFADILDQTNRLLLLTLVFITIILPHENYFVMENSARFEKKEKYFLIWVKVVRTTHGFVNFLVRITHGFWKKKK